MPPPHPYANLQRFLLGRYKTAYDLLSSDPVAAERIFIELLQEARLPIWVRIQCNGNLAFLADDISAAQSYLADARHTLSLFIEGRTPPVPDPLEAGLQGIEDMFSEAQADIAYRLEHPEEEDEPQEESYRNDEVEHGDDPQDVDTGVALKVSRNSANHEDEDEMLLGNHED
ncbi:hypothetical protein LTR17_017881 [Elasticomyces elasticus]|nr:hypothetical protein LTR17_017881 [Elasticomyces elasticus]